MANFKSVSYLVYVIFTPIVSFIFAVLNIMTIVIFARRFRLVSLPLVIIVNICICDIVVCIVSNNFYMANLLHPRYTWSTGAVACKLFKTLTMTCNISQTFSFVILCLDRARRIIAATRTQWSKADGLCALAVVWITSVTLTSVRMMLFDEIEKEIYDLTTNTTKTVDFTCSPVKLNSTFYVTFTIAQFVIAYLIPLVSIAAILTICEVHMRRIKFQGQTPSSAVLMNRRLSIVFGLTALLFLCIWTPFYVLSIFDLKYALRGRPELLEINMTFRCTLLVVGSGKPIVYLTTMQRYRDAMFCKLCSSRSPKSDLSLTETRHSDSNLEGNR